MSQHDSAKDYIRNGATNDYITSAPQNNNHSAVTQRHQGAGGRTGVRRSHATVPPCCHPEQCGRSAPSRTAAHQRHEAPQTPRKPRTTPGTPRTNHQPASSPHQPPDTPGDNT